MNWTKDNFLKKKMAIDELKMDMPDNGWLLEAREKVKLRKTAVEISNTKKCFSFGWLDFNRLQAGFMVLLICVGVFYFSHLTNSQSAPLSENNNDSGSSIKSSTVLASLTQYTNEKASVKSSTVLTSIITFVARN